MSQPAPETPPAGAAPRPAGRDNTFTHKIGPLPMWGWVAIAAGLLVAWRLYSSKKSPAAQQQSGQSASSTDTAANTVPQFVNQTYTTVTAPAAPAAPPSGPAPVIRHHSDDDDTPATPAAPAAPSSPSNPAPVGSSTQPKPTTTTPGSWHYPAPTALALVNQSSKGVSFAWDAVTGPSGQHPNSYTVATYDSKGKLVDQFSTAAGKTSANEFGKGGKGLPKGTYHTNVWANGGPVGPPHSTVQYTLKA
jgi:cytoskeletal protein RodZ